MPDKSGTIAVISRLIHDKVQISNWSGSVAHLPRTGGWGIPAFKCAQRHKCLSSREKSAQSGPIGMQQQKLILRNLGKTTLLLREFSCAGVRAYCSLRFINHDI